MLRTPHLRPLLLASTLLVAAGCKPQPPRLEEDRVVMVKSSDAEMNAAIAKAKARLPEFWEHLAEPAPDETGFAVKAAVRDAHGTEFFWLVRPERRDGKVWGTVDNTPNIVKSVKDGERLEVADADVVDWMFMKAGRMHGNFTLRPLLPSLDPEEAAQLRAMLAEP
jgi:uncharacterized protein YegJ (DUF2314 family)